MVAVKYMGEYNYIPSIPAAVIFAVIFGIACIAHSWQMYRNRTWFFIPFICGGIFEIAGYAARAVSSNQYPNYTIGPLAVQAVLIMVAPSLYAATIYMTLGRIMIVTGGEKYSIIRRSWLTKIFVFGDVICFLIQAGGAGMLVQVSTAANGEKIIKIGLIVQIIFLALFLVTSVSFHIRLSRGGSAYSMQVPWKRHQMALYITSALVFVRSIFRFIEYALGGSGPLLQHEYWSYIFDACLMVIVMLVFNLIYPGEIGDLLRERKKGGDGIELLEEQRYESGNYP
ncbi:hypothetical protein N7523_007808 [Penicillium sp. IBT 18751x]|nr:hypothetical protein N7523_007808 [Penicillium sp. IBT 18751x]